MRKRKLESAFALGIGAFAMGALAIGALAIGAIAIGSIAIKRAAVLDARLRSLVVGDLSGGRLRVEHLEVSDSIELPDGAGGRSIEPG
jgi:hypothetical protein